MTDPIARIASAPRLLVALDFDGVLSPLVTDPMSARATPAAKRAVTALLDAPGVVVAFVSGRALGDLREIAEHDDDSRVWLAGSHGAEHWRPGAGRLATDDAADPADAERIRSDAAAVAEGFEGAWIESKRYGFALHTRTSPEGVEPRAQAAVDDLMRGAAPAWRRRDGKHVLEFAWRHEGKDAAVAELRRETAADAVVFAGDDVTDEDALRSLEATDLGIRVGPGETAATLRVEDPDELAAVLTRIAESRAL